VQREQLVLKIGSVVRRPVDGVGAGGAQIKLAVAGGGGQIVGKELRSQRQQMQSIRQ